MSASTDERAKPAGKVGDDSGLAGDAPGIVVIGAGPAGLNLGDRLARRGVRARILEKGDGPADSWRRMPRDMMLNSPAGVSVLDGVRVGFREWGRVWNRERFHRHAVAFQRERGLDIDFGVTVEKVVREAEGGFRIDTGDGPIRAATVVNATGYFSKPYVPARPGADASSLLQLTVPEYGSPEAVAERLGGRPGRVLIVGARITAGQLGVELHDAGFAVTISHRRPIAFGFDPRVQRLGFRAYYPYEALRLRDPAFARRDSGHPMQGGRARELIESGAIDTRPDLVRFEDRRIVFADGRVDAFDAVLWATGYRPALDHLGGLVELDPQTGLPKLSGMESATTPGLYFLGLDQLTDFTSRMLRGIRRDAARLAARLCEPSVSGGSPR